jgi:hypothetical protein
MIYFIEPRQPSGVIIPYLLVEASEHLGFRILLMRKRCSVYTRDEHIKATVKYSGLMLVGS